MMVVPVITTNYEHNSYAAKEWPVGLEQSLITVATASPRTNIKKIYQLEPVTKIIPHR